MSSRILSSTFFLCGFLIGPSIATAATLTLNDCNGMPRVVQEMKDSELAAVHLTLQSRTAAADNPNQTAIVNEQTGAQMTASVRGGEAVVEDVRDGTWQWCDQQNWVLQDARVLLPNERGFTSKSALGAGVAALAIPAIVLGTRQSGSDSESLGTEPVLAAKTVEPSSPNTDHEQDVSRALTQPPDSNQDCARAARSSRRSPCRNEETPPPVSPYS